MKHITQIILAMLIYGSVAAAEITSIDGPSTACPNKPVTYRIQFNMRHNPPLLVETVNKIIWELRQNGIVVYSQTGASAILNVPGLPAGPVEINVKIEYSISAMGRVFLSHVSKTKNIVIGVASAESISGTNICPNASGTFTIPYLANATSYTWEVPAGWKVNGTTGPVVTSPDPSVSITPCPFTNDSTQNCKTTFYTNYTIKVKGVSAACGTGNYTTKTITIDHPVRITETNLSNNDVKLNATPTNFPSYQWTLDTDWYFPTSGNINLPEVSFNGRGTTGLAKLTYKTPCQNTYNYDWWWVPPAEPGDPGWSGDPPDPDPDPGDCEPEIPTNPNSARSSHVIYLRDPCEEEPPVASLYANGAMKRVTLTKSFDGYEYDISELKAGAYILRIKTAKGKFKTVKFIMLD